MLKELPEVLRANPDGERKLCTEIFCAAGYPAENAAFDARIKAFMQEPKQAQKAPGFEQILLPGELEEPRSQYNEANGIKMGRGAFTQLYETCKEYGITDDPMQYIIGED